MEDWDAERPVWKVDFALRGMREHVNTFAGTSISKRRDRPTLLSTDLLSVLDNAFDDCEGTVKNWGLRVEVNADSIGSATGRNICLDVIATAEYDNRLVLICDNRHGQESGSWSFGELACLLRGRNKRRDLKVLIPLSCATFTDLGSTGTLELIPSKVVVDEKTGIMTLSLEDVGKGLDATGNERPGSYSSKHIKSFGMSQRRRIA